MSDTVHSLFPTAVYQTSIDRKFTKKEILFLDKQKNNLKKIEGNSKTINSYVLNEKPLKQLKNDLTNASHKYYKNIFATYNKITPYITQSWLNYNVKGEHHHSHEHPNSIVSGVFYLKADEAHDKITFHKDKYSQINFETNEYNTWNSLTWWIPVKSGDILLFPSYLNHSVETKQDNNLRISLAFNTFVRGNIGSREGLSELNL